MMAASPWLLVVIGGAIVLGAVLAYGQMQSRKRDREVDPHTPSDDPSKGM